MWLKKWCLWVIVLGISGCQSVEPLPNRITIGAVGHDENNGSIERFDELKTYLGQELKSIIELEPVYNEVKGLQQIQRHRWDIVFAPPGLAALAISQYQYTPIFPLAETLNTRSIFVVRQESPIQQSRQLAGQSLALGPVGSAAGYYLPLYSLFGLILAEIRLTDSPRQVLGLVATQKVAAGALSLEEYNTYRSNYPKIRFRILPSDAPPLPNGSVLISSRVELRLADRIQKVLRQTPAPTASSAGFIPNAEVPDYRSLIQVIDRVNRLADRLDRKPVSLKDVPPKK